LSEYTYIPTFLLILNYAKRFAQDWWIKVRKGWIGVGKRKDGIVYTQMEHMVRWVGTAARLQQDGDYALCK
jgi:hypothetical protein